MIEWLTGLSVFLMTYGVKSLVVAKLIEAIGVALPPPFRKFFLSLLKYKIAHFGKIAIIGIPISITVEMIVGFFIGRVLFGF